MTLEEAIKLLEKTKDSAVFVDGFNESRKRKIYYDIMIVKHGDGQNPLGRISTEVYLQLIALKVIQDDSYGGQKGRKYHDYNPSWRG
jgi:hypothetical protein